MSQAVVNREPGTYLIDEVVVALALAWWVLKLKLL
jgi:hypothetical protein